VTAHRVTLAAAERIAAHLSERDWHLVRELRKTRVATGNQLTRLLFDDLSPHTRDRVRRRVLARLADRQVVAVLERQIGGVRAGSSGAVYTLGVAGQRLAQIDAASTDELPRIRRPWTPSALFLNHSLAVTELYVRLVERSRSAPFKVSGFETEPACWWPNGWGGFVKPDALVMLSTARYDELVWLEVDRGTESLPTIKRKLLDYVDFVEGGQLGPRDAVPYVVITTPDEQRRSAVRQLVDVLPNVPDGLFSVVTFEEAADFLSGLALDQANKPP
jgi:hypothetical protein